MHVKPTLRRAPRQNRNREAYPRHRAIGRPEIAIIGKCRTPYYQTAATSATTLAPCAAGASPGQIPDPPAIGHPAASLGPRSAIAILRARRVCPNGPSLGCSRGYFLSAQTRQRFVFRRCPKCAGGIEGILSAWASVGSLHVQDATVVVCADGPLEALDRGQRSKQWGLQLPVFRRTGDVKAEGQGS
jgi:hypothetical protein